MIAQPQPWLETIPWERVVEQNQQLCAAAQLPHHVVPERHDQVRKLWETVAAQAIDLPAALDTLRQCASQAPFQYNNLNTFAAIARKLVDTAARHLPAVEAHILSSTVSQYVEKRVAKSELRQIITHLDKQLPACTGDLAAPPQAPSVQAQSMAT